MNRLQRNIDLLNFLLLFNGFKFMLLKNAPVLYLNDEYTDSTKLLSPKDLYKEIAAVVPRDHVISLFLVLVL
jgi:hypothetical protein